MVTESPTVPINTTVVHLCVPLDPETEPFIPTPRRKTGHPRNPYKLKRNSPDEEWRIESFDHFKVYINSVNDIISILMKHTDHSMEAWYLLWQEWIKDDLLTANNLHMVAVTVDLPPKVEKTHKGVAVYILSQLPGLDRYIKIPNRTRDDDPLCHIYMPHIETDLNPIENNPFQALAADDETKSVSEMEEIDELIDSDVESVNSTTTMLKEMDEISNKVDEELNDIVTIIDKDDHKKANASKATAGLQKEDIYNYMIEQQQLLNAKHEDFLKNTVTTELARLQALFKKATTDIMNSSTEQQQILVDTSSNTINTCANLCSENKTSLDKHATTLVATLSTKLNEAEAEAYTKHSNNWSGLSNKMSTTYSQLVKTNKVAIKNNTILEKKLSATKSTVSKLEETIAIQEAIIKNLSLTMDKIGNKYKNITSELTPAYLNNINTLVTTNFDTISTNICEDMKTKTEHLVDKLCKEKCSYLSDRVIDVKKELAEKAKKLEENTCKNIEKHAKTTICSNCHIDSRTNNLKSTTSILIQYTRII